MSSMKINILICIISVIIKNYILDHYDFLDLEVENKKNPWKKTGYLLYTKPFSDIT